MIWCFFIGADSPTLSNHFSGWIGARPYYCMEDEMYYKKLIGKKCYLAPMDANDAEQFTEWFNDLELMVNIDLYHALINVDGERAFLSNPPNPHTYSIVDAEKDTLIGNCGLMDVDQLNRIAEVGILIGDKNYFDKGYGTEALRLLLDYGFKALNLHNVMLRVYDYNTRAIKCYEKIGFKKIGARREALHRNLEKHDVVYMDILVDEFYGKGE
jgi:RimJ/RimL family protein N-acetyltransferase